MNCRQWLDLFINRWIILQRPASNSDPFDPKGVLPLIACRCCGFVDFQGLGLLNKWSVSLFVLVLQESLTNTLSSQRRLHVRLSASGKRLRVIVVTPGYDSVHNQSSDFTMNPSSHVVATWLFFHFVIRFTDVADVVQAIRTHPDAEVAKCLKIGAVTCCIDPLNTFIENRCGYGSYWKRFAITVTKKNQKGYGQIASDF